MGAGVSPAWLLAAVATTLVIGREAQRQSMIDDATEEVKLQLAAAAEEMQAELEQRALIEAQLASALVALEAAAAVEAVARQAAAEAAARVANVETPLADIAAREREELRALLTAVQAPKAETEAALQKLVDVARPLSERLAEIEAELKPLTAIVDRGEREGGMAQLRTIGPRLKVNTLALERTSKLEQLKELSAKQASLSDEAAAQSLQSEMQMEKVRQTAATERKEFRTPERMRELELARVATEALAPIIEALEEAARAKEASVASAAEDGPTL